MAIGMGPLPAIPLQAVSLDQPMSAGLELGGSLSIWSLDVCRG